MLADAVARAARPDPRGCDMSRQAVKGIGQVIKDNTVEKSIEDLRAEGKKRVRVVSSERVMAIIQAIVDDTINSEVGEITKRDRDRIVSDTQERFSNVLKMQQDLEQDIDDLRGSLREAELERDRLRGEKSLLEAQVQASRRVEGEDDAVARLAREVARMRDAVERSPRDGGALDEAALARLLEKFAARDAQTTRRLAAEFEDLRTRLESVVRDAAAVRESSAEKLVQRLNVRQCETDAHVEERLNRGFKEVTDHVAELRSQVGRAPAVEEAVARLRSDFAAIEKRIQGVESAPAEMAKRVATAVLNGLEERDAEDGGRRAAEATNEAALVTETLRRMQRASDESRESLLHEMTSLRATVDAAATRSAGAQAEQVRDLERRVEAQAAAAGEADDALTQTVGRLADRVATLDASLLAMRREIAESVDRAISGTATASQAEATARLEGSLTALRGDLADAIDRAVSGSAKTSHSEAAARLDGSVAELRAEFASLNARGIEAAERQEAAIRALREQVAMNAAVQSGSLESTFKGALEQALDKITRTMERATARPIEMTGEATDVLLAKMFDVPDGEMTSNLDQLDVEQRTSKAKIAGSVGRLKEMNGRGKPDGK
jgi:hypothetical protein